MKVSTRVHYGLRAMTELARSYSDGGLLSIAEIARSEALPLAYLEQLVGEYFQYFSFWHRILPGEYPPLVKFQKY